MNAKKKADTKTTKKQPKVKSKPPAAKKKLSALDAAALVLAESGGSMTTGELIEAMAQKKLWESPNGKTPAATLYAAILREINTKGKESRFKKTEPGKFAATGVTGKESAAAIAASQPAEPKAAKPAKKKAGQKNGEEAAPAVAAEGAGELISA
jgi:hypothetical protein